MKLQLNWKYKFTFDSNFSHLDGIYNVTKIYTYSESITEGIELFSSLFEGTDITEVEFEKEYLPRIRTEPIYKLVNVVKTSNVIYVPEMLITSQPDSNITKYYNTVITWNTGAYKDKEQLTHITNMVKELIEKIHGTDKPPILIDIGTIYLTDSEYQQIENNRLNIKEDAFTWFSENQKIQAENLALRDKCLALEQALIELTP